VSKLSGNARTSHAGGEVAANSISPSTAAAAFLGSLDLDKATKPSSHEAA
jgi:hypothetical protein